MMSALDLFSGVGWHIGAKELDIEEEGVEIMPQAVATRDAIGAKTVHDDVWTYDYRRGAHEGHIASPPCQTFSMAGKGSGRKALDDVLGAIHSGAWHTIDGLRALEEGGDPRTALVLMPLHAWFVERPEWVAWEQVPTVQPVWDACADVLRADGYSVWTGRLQAEQYGVPQTRKRSILIASRVREVGAPKPTHSRYYPRSPQKLDEGVQKWMSMAEALGWDHLDRVVSNYGSGGDASNRGERLGSEPSATVTSKIDRNIVYRSTKMPNSAVRPVDSPAPTIAFDPDANSARWCYDRPPTTIVGSFKPEIVAAPGYRTTVSRQNAEGSVRVTVAEAGLLQSFPADMPWQGAKGKQFLQVGNAVCPLWAIAILGEAAGLPWNEAATNYSRRIYGTTAPTDVESGKWIVAAGVTGAGVPRPGDHPAPTMTGKGTAYILTDPSQYGTPIRPRPKAAADGEA